jgi:hypothetical protein
VLCAWCDLAGELSVFAGSGQQATVDGVGTKASFDYPTALAIDATNNLYVVDYNQVRATSHRYS